MKTLVLILASLATFLIPIHGLLLLMILFIVTDTVFGIYSTVKRKGWKSFKSTKLFNLVVKSFFYLFSIVLAFLVDKHVFQSNLFGVAYFASKSMSLVWIYIEIKSIDETSVGLGNRSIWVILKEMIAKAAEFKKDLKSVDNE
jgi:ABC-type sugar transport system permease subunit